MKAVIFILRAIKKKSSFIIKRNPSISSTKQLIIVFSTIKLLLPKIRDKFLVVLLAYMAEKQIVKGLDIGIRTISNNVDGCLRTKDMFYGYK
jgi:hypothetical protein